MNKEWNLDFLYKGYEDPEFLGDIKKLERVCEKMNQLSVKLAQTETLADLSMVNNIVDLWEEKMRLEESLMIYCNLRQSVDTSNAQSASYLGYISQKASDCAKADS
ncbi:MAG: peptidase M3, partial [Clostridiales bacterium]|nr:peptidase M3 [Clostridiales bacterium]